MKIDFELDLQCFR